MSEIALVPVGPPASDADGRRERGMHFRRRLAFLAVVVVPTLVAAIYYAFVATDRYEAISQFVIRSPSNAATSQLASLVQGSSIVRSSDDAFVVHAYLASRDIVRKLVETSDLRARLGRTEIDFLWRYPSPFLSHNEERLYTHVQRIVSVDYDYSTGITTLKVQAFRPEDAKAIADAMLAASEAFINGMSDRAQTDAVAAAEREVAQSRVLAGEALANVTAYRNKVGMIDPGRVSGAALETIARLALEAAQTSAQIAEIEKTSPQSTQIVALQHRKAALDEQIRNEQMHLVGSSASLVPIIEEYERLTMERAFAERAFASALSALEVARLDAVRQKLFLERISSPSAPDYPQYPSRLIGILVVFLVSVTLYGIGRMLLRNAREHSDM